MPGGAAHTLRGMDQLTVRACQAIELEQSPALPTLVEEYAGESTRASLGDYQPQFEMYRRLEEMGVMRFAGAWLGSDLVGFVTVGAARVPHYGGVTATTESLFVASHARKTGAGKLLLEKAEEMAVELGAVGLFVSAPSGGRLSAVLPRIGYQRSNEVFFKGLA